MPCDSLQLHMADLPYATLQTAAILYIVIMPSNNFEHEKLDKIIEDRILHGLSLEWESAASFLEQSSNYSLKKPLFSLKDLKNNLAYWDGRKREICFSRSFVSGHSWDSLREVLLHEMAHQLTGEVFKAVNEPPHGDTFKQACHLMRANPKASGTYLPLSERILRPDADEDDKIMYRVQKLLALAKSCYVHEAEAALSKAHDLIKKYNIDLLKRKDKREYISIYAGKPALKRFREEYALANLITEHYFVFGIWVSAYVIEKGKMGRVLEISGTKKNIKIAAYVYDFISNFINNAWNNYNIDKQFSRYRKTDFATGIIDGFKSKLTKNFVEDSGKQIISDRQPVVIEDKQLKDYTGYRYPHIKTIKRRASNIDEKIIRDGEEIGKKLVISKGIEDKKSTCTAGLLN